MCAVLSSHLWFFWLGNLPFSFKKMKSLICVPNSYIFMCRLSYVLAWRVRIPCNLKLKENWAKCPSFWSSFFYCNHDCGTSNGRTWRDGKWLLEKRMEAQWWQVKGLASRGCKFKAPLYTHLGGLHHRSLKRGWGHRRAEAPHWWGEMAG